MPSAPLALALAALALVATGCGTIVNGTSQDISFLSEPEGATVLVDGTALGETPLIAALSRGSSHTVTFELAGYESESLIVEKGVSGWVAGNLIFGGLIGLGVDLATGGMYKLTPDQVSAGLNAEVATMPDGSTMLIAVVMTADPSWEKVGQLTPAP